MNTDFEGSLKRLKLEDGAGGVQVLMPQRRLSTVFPDTPEDEHLHIVVEHPTISELRSSSPQFSSVMPLAFFIHADKASASIGISSTACS